jgi:hypothetical protein
MSYAAKFLISRGLDCTILRDTPITSKVSIKRSSNSATNPGNREALWEGLILADSNLQSGEVITIDSENYLIQSVNRDPSRELAFFAAKSNAELEHKRYGKHVDEEHNVIQEWRTIHNNIYAYGEIVTAALRQYDPGLLPQTRYIFQVPKSLGIIERDRIIYSNSKYDVQSIDDIALKGVVRIQLSIDSRPD